MRPPQRLERTVKTLQDARTVLGKKVEEQRLQGLDLSKAEAKAKQLDTDLKAVRALAEAARKAAEEKRVADVANATVCVYSQNPWFPHPCCTTISAACFGYLDLAYFVTRGFFVFSRSGLGLLACVNHYLVSICK